MPNFEELTYYAGVLTTLAVVLAVRRPSRRSLFYLALMALGLLLAFGSYGFLYRVFYNLLPPFRLARAPGRAAVVYLFAASALLGEVVGSRRVWQRTALDGPFSAWPFSRPLARSSLWSIRRIRAGGCGINWAVGRRP
ncbi:MAG: hypothetical protein IPJ94_25900 [Chloroflexi bacterium]|nr:hypothetical protein [Chloroflexota bacterium]